MRGVEVPPRVALRTAWAQRDRKAANRRIRRIFRDLLPEDGTLLVMSLDRA